MTSVTAQILELLDLQHQTWAHIPPGQEPPLEDQLQYYLAKRDLFRVAAESSLSTGEVKDAIAAYDQAASKVLQLSAREKTRDGPAGETGPVRDAMTRLAGWDEPTQDGTGH